MFSDPAAVGEVLYPLADNVGTVRDLATYDEVADATTIAHHREFDSFGALLTPITDAHAFAFTGREFDTDSNLQYSRNRWFDNSIGKFVSEDPMSFDAGDANITRYVFNNPLTASDPSGQGFFSDIFDSVGDFFEDVGDVFEDAWDGFVEHVVDPIENEFERFGHFVDDAVHDTGDFFEEQWENGNIQKALLAASVVISAGAFAPLLAGGFTTFAAGGSFAAGFSGAAATAAATNLGAVAVSAATAKVYAATTAIGFASAGVSGYETFSGDQIGDGTLRRVLGTAAAVTGAYYGGFTAAGQFSPTDANLLGLADGAVSGYEIATGDTIGDGTLSAVLNFASVAPSSAGTLFAPRDPINGPNWAQRTGAGLRISASAGAVASTGDPELQRSLRAISIASSVWNTGTGLTQALPGLAKAGTAIYDAGAAFVGRVRNAFAPQQPTGYASLRSEPGYINADPNARRIGSSEPNGSVVHADGIVTSGGVQHAGGVAVRGQNPGDGNSTRMDELLARAYHVDPLAVEFYNRKGVQAYLDIQFVEPGWWPFHQPSYLTEREGGGLTLSIYTDSSKLEEVSRFIRTLQKFPSYREWRATRTEEIAKEIGYQGSLLPPPEMRTDLTPIQIDSEIKKLELIQRDVYFERLRAAGATEMEIAGVWFWKTGNDWVGPGGTIEKTLATTSPLAAAKAGHAGLTSRRYDRVMDKRTNRQWAQVRPNENSNPAHNASVPLPLPAKDKRLRDQYLGGTPDKYSRTGRDVLARMTTENLIRGEGTLKTRGNAHTLEVFIEANGTWYPINEKIDMGHRTDAVTWWNQIGRHHGAKSKEVRTFMLDPFNYEFLPQTLNRSDGGKLGATEQYLPVPPHLAPTTPR